MINSVQFSVAVMAAALLTGCPDQSTECEGAVIGAILEDVHFGDLRLGQPPGADGDLLVPERQVYFIRNECGEPLVVDSVCLVSNTHNQDPDTVAFYSELEPGESLPLTITSGKQAGIRITFEVDSINGDSDGDGEPDPNVAALVIHSNASNEPAHVVPVCGRVVADGEPTDWPCELPENFAAPEPGQGDCIR